MSKAFRCDRCGNLIEDEVQAEHPNLVTGYSENDTIGIRIEICRTDSNCDHCEPCIRAVVADFLKRDA